MTDNSNNTDATAAVAKRTSVTSPRSRPTSGTTHDVIMRRQSRESMDDVIREVRKSGGRSSLAVIEDDFVSSLDFFTTTDARLLDVIAKLTYASPRVAQDNDKYYVQRDGLTSFVYLCHDKGTRPSRQRVSGL